MVQDANAATGEADEAVRLAADGVRADPRMWQAWDVLGRALELQRDFEQAFSAYTRVLDLEPESLDVFGKLGRTALGFGDYGTAQRCLAHQLGLTPGSVETIADLARAQMLGQAFGEALATLRAGLEAHPTQPVLWTELGRCLCLEGRAAEAAVFFEEALRLDPGSAQARDGLADALLLGAGEVDGALDEGAAALAAAAPADRSDICVAQARRLLAAGGLGQGWTLLRDAFEGGRDHGVEIKAAAPRWRPGGALADRQLLVIGDEAVGEEILFAQTLPRLMAEGPHLVLAIDPRWTELARRSFAGAEVVPLLRRRRRGVWQYRADTDEPHMHGGRLIDAWTTLRSLASAYRSDLADFAGAGAYLKPDRDRVGHWRDWLASLGAGPKAGLICREPAVDAHAMRDLRHIPGFASALSGSGVMLVSLQGADLDGLRQAGVGLHAPPGLDPAADFDDLAALACALDVTIGPRCPATTIAAACGAAVRFLAPSRAWAMLGADAHPWFPEATVFSAATLDGWAEAMAALGADLARIGQR